MIKIPEVVLQDTLEDILKFIKLDLEANSSDETKTYLYRVFGDLTNKNYDFFNQAKEILTRPESEDRVFNFYQSFSSDRTQYPAVYINSFSEEEDDSINQIGAGVIGHDSKMENVFNSTPEYDDYVNSFERRFKSMFEFLFVGETKTQTLTLKYLVQSMLISLRQYLENRGLRNQKISTQRVKFVKEIPDKLFVNFIGYKFDYETIVPSLETHRSYKDVLRGNVTINTNI